MCDECGPPNHQAPLVGKHLPRTMASARCAFIEVMAPEREKKARAVDLLIACTISAEPDQACSTTGTVSEACFSASMRRPWAWTQCTWQGKSPRSWCAGYAIFASVSWPPTHYAPIRCAAVPLPIEIGHAAAPSASPCRRLLGAACLAHTEAEESRERGVALPVYCYHNTVNT